MKTPDYLSYDRYKKKKDTNPKRRFTLFVGTFIVSLITFLVLAKTMVPDVDVTIGDEPEFEEKNIGLGVKQFVDSRLKSIDLDDLGKGSLRRAYEDDDNNSETVEEEKIVLPEKKEEKKVVETNKDEPVMPAYEAPRPEKSDIIAQAEPQKAMIKVYVGRYSNSTQASVAKDILMDSGMDVSPFVKNLNGVYTLQIGSFSDRARAEQIAEELRKNGFPARLVQE